MIIMSSTFRGALSVYRFWFTTPTPTIISYTIQVNPGWFLIGTSSNAIITTEEPSIISSVIGWTNTIDGTINTQQYNPIIDDSFKALTNNIEILANTGYWINYTQAGQITITNN